MDDVYATGRSHVLRHTLEHRKHLAALKVEHHGTSEDYEYLKRLRSPREDALESQSNPRYVQKVVSTTANQSCHHLSLVTKKGQTNKKSVQTTRKQNPAQLSDLWAALSC